MLSGRVAELGALRHTPAGIPIVEFLVAHASEQIEAGIPRRVECELPAVMLGEAAKGLAGADGAAVRLTGFLARRSPRSRQPVLHVNSFEIIG